MILLVPTSLALEGTIVVPYGQRGVSEPVVVDPGEQARWSWNTSLPLDFTIEVEGAGQLRWFDVTPQDGRVCNAERFRVRLVWFNGDDAVGSPEDAEPTPQFDASVNYTLVTEPADHHCVNIVDEVAEARMRSASREREAMFPAFFLGAAGAAVGAATSYLLWRRRKPSPPLPPGHWTETAR